MPDVAIVIGWKPGECRHRARALDWVLARHRSEHPEMDVVLATQDASGPWIKAAAVMPAVADSTAAIIVVSDADVWTEGLDDAITAVERGAPWAIPHLLVDRLTDYATAELLAGTPLDKLDTAERPYRGVQGGGIVVLRRDTLLQIPLDPRFEGWGQEDTSWAIALHVLAGPAWRGDARLLHLWHPPQPRMNRKIGSTTGQQLFRRYAQARRDPDQMRDLIQEVHTCLSPLS